MAPRLRGAVLPAVALLVLATTTACGPSPNDGGSAYVAIGDSYTAGPYLGTPDGSDGCVRSKENYPHLVAEQADLDLDDVSCSSATTRNVLSSQVTPRGAVPPQIKAVGRKTDLVTMGIGFNDFGLSARVFGACPALAVSQPGISAPCTAADSTAGAKALQPSLDQLPDRIREVVEAVQDKAPDARIILVGYPTIFPADQTCSDLPLAPGDLPLVHHVVDTINEALASVARDLDLTFVDMAEATEGHDICAEDPWIAGAANDQTRGASPWHPYREEQQRVADRVVAELD